MKKSPSAAIQWHKLLGRAPARVEPEACAHLQGTSVLVTGTGGSIGSALAKAVLEGCAENVILLDSSEQALYRLTSEIGNSSRAIPILGSVLDEVLLDEVFDRFSPAFVFHAAAFKHLPMLETQPFAAIENNTIGTYLVARAAEQFGARRLVLVSTDKAVNPTSIMGASKRLAELLIASFARTTTVRLANVIGSDGSVAPRFIEQIERGEPITITNPEATRYFFTIEETVKIILFASRVEAENTIVIPAEVEPTKISKIAEFLLHEIAFDGRSRVEYTGLCAGEKFNEELAYGCELRQAKQLVGCRVVPNPPPLRDVEGTISDLRLSIRERDFDRLIEAIQRHVPEYVPSAQLKERFSASAARLRA